MACRFIWGRNDPSFYAGWSLGWNHSHCHCKHSDFVLEGVSDPCALFHARLIRDADKLDNFRVKLEDDLLTFMGMPGEEIGALEISPKVYETVFRSSTILSADRITKWITGYPIWFISLTWTLRKAWTLLRKTIILKTGSQNPVYQSCHCPSDAGNPKHAQEYIKKFKGV